MGAIDTAFLGLLLSMTGIGLLTSVVVKFIQRAGGGLR